MKINAFDNAKKFIVLFAALIIIGTVILCVFGLNKGQEVAGRIEIDLNMGRYNIVEENDVKDFTNKVIKIINDNNGNVLQTNVQDSSFDAVLVVSVKAKSTNRSENVDFANELKAKIDSEFNDELLITSAKFESGIMTNTTVVKLAYITLFAIIIAMIYLIARIKLLNTMCVLATCLTSVLLFVDLVIITRVQINTNVIGITLITAIMGFVIPSFKFFDLKNSKGAKVTKEDCVLTLNSLTAKLIIITIIPMIALCLLGTPLVRSYAITVMLSLISVCLADSLVKMPLCYYLTYYTTAKNKPAKTEEVLPEASLDNKETTESN